MHPGWDVDLLNDDGVGLFVDESESGAQRQLFSAESDRLGGRFRKRNFYGHPGLKERDGQTDTMRGKFVFFFVGRCCFFLFCFFLVFVCVFRFLK